MDSARAAASALHAPPDIFSNIDLSKPEALGWVVNRKMFEDLQELKAVNPKLFAELIQSKVFQEQYQKVLYLVRHGELDKKLMSEMREDKDGRLRPDKDRNEWGESKKLSNGKSTSSPDPGPLRDQMLLRMRSLEVVESAFAGKPRE
ncbi:MAG: hypothetical protein KDD60_08620, partial [Bdellovibrionales bacterium]|nr:hypothetical protein [Bdellovibrionales bacterium]